jgi:biofilm PGA synthesis N-glycosyltransferase PgaC
MRFLPVAYSTSEAGPEHTGEQQAPRVLIVSPVRNEGAHIERVARAVAAQELAPARWIAIDDGSSDDTLRKLRALERELPLLTVLQAPARGGEEQGRDRLARAIEVRNFNVALAQTGWERRAGDRAQAGGQQRAARGGQTGSERVAPGEHYTHLMKLDGDVELPRNYLRVLLERFACASQLGIAGGVLVEPQAAGAPRRIVIPSYHVHGAVKCYTRACYEAIGGVPECLGWDTIDETYARMRGFQTRSYTDLVSVHHRPVASADGALRGHARHGECAYISHYDPLWVALRALKVAGRAPRGLSGAAFFFGYARAAGRRVQRVPDAEYRRFTRRELRRRMLGVDPGRAG